MIKVSYIKSKPKRKTKNKVTITKPIIPQFNSYTVKVPSEFPLDRPLTKNELIKFYEDCLEHPIWIREKK